MYCTVNYLLCTKYTSIYIFVSESSELDTLDKKVSTNMNIYMNIHIFDKCLQ